MTPYLKTISLFLGILFGFITYAQNNPEIYPYTTGAKVAPEFKVKVNGTEVQVYDSPVGAFVTFGLNGKVDLTIESTFDIKRVDIRPKSKNIAYNLENNIVKFSIDNPSNLSIEYNYNIGRPLFIFANPISKPLTKNEAKNAIVFKAGQIHKPGKIQVKSNQTLLIEGGAMVEGNIVVENAENVTIKGYGIVNGGFIKSLPKDYTDKFRRLFNIYQSRNVLLEGIVSMDSHTWDVVPELCKNLRINNIKIISGNGGDDGIDVVGSSKVVIENSFVRTKDDCIAVKALKKGYEDSVMTDLLVKNCVFWNAEWGNALEIGFETRIKRMENMRFIDNDIIHVIGGAALSIHAADFAEIKDIYFENIRIENVTQKLIDVAVFFSLFSRDSPYKYGEFTPDSPRYLHGVWDNVIKLNPEEYSQYAGGRGKVYNVYFTNIQVTDGVFPFSVIEGYDAAHDVKNIVLKDVYIHGKKIENEEQLRLFKKFASGIEIK